jgi:hypothetical protein
MGQEGKRGYLAAADESVDYLRRRREERARLREEQKPACYF